MVYFMFQFMCSSIRIALTISLFISIGHVDVDSEMEIEMFYAINLSN